MEAESFSLERVWETGESCAEQWNMAGQIKRTATLVMF
jgi:hypothetical protein